MEQKKRKLIEINAIKIQCSPNEQIVEREKKRERAGANRLRKCTYVT